jgi:hypothetical protein
MVSGVPQSIKPTSLVDTFNPLAYSPPSKLVQAVKFIDLLNFGRGTAVLNGARRGSS